MNIRKPLAPQSLHAGRSPGWKRPTCHLTHPLPSHEIVFQLLRQNPCTTTPFLTHRVIPHGEGDYPHHTHPL